MDLATAGWLTLGSAIVLLLVRELIDPSKQGKPGNFVPEIRRAKMLFTGVAVLCFGLLMLLTDQFLPTREYSRPPSTSPSIEANPNHDLGVSILFLYGSILCLICGILILRNRNDIVARMRRNPGIVQPIDVSTEDKMLQIYGWFLVTAGVGLFSWAAVTWILRRAAA